MMFSIAPVLIGISAITLAYLFYGKKNDLPEKLSVAFGGFYQWAYRKFYIDEVYVFVTKKVLFNLIGRPSAWFDRNIVDGIMNGSATATASASESIKSFQSGRLQTYAMFFLGGVLLIAALLILNFM